jgi:CubicO group peptidase (beta-lactamase class C family)
MPPSHGAVQGFCTPPFQAVADQFAQHLAQGLEIGAGLCVYHHGAVVVDLWGGVRDQQTHAPWTDGTLIVVFSVTKGLAAIALNLAAERGMFAWDALVAQYWPAFAQNGKAAITVRQLFNHRAGLAGISAPLSLDMLCDPTQAQAVEAILAAQAPACGADAGQGYHALSFGMYASAFFAHACGEPLQTFLHREYLDPLGADVHLGTPPSEDHRVATLYPPSNAKRLRHMLWAALRGGSAEANVARSFLRGGLAKQAFMNPPAPGGLGCYNTPPVRRHSLVWASATASARGLALAYVPWSLGGRWRGRQWLAPATVAQVQTRQGWAAPDAVLGKPLGWAQGFLKEEEGVFSPHRESFGHPGMGGALGWCDPKAGLSIGYTMNRMDWRVRSPRTLALCHAIYQCALA